MDTKEKPQWETDSKPQPQVETQTELLSQQQSQQLTDGLVETTIPTRRLRRLGPPMPPDDMLRLSIADNLMQIVGNMTNDEYQRQCCEIFQVSELTHGVHGQILAALQHIDEQRQRPGGHR
ncbi:uncharacterized protein [Drosophila pseudoobscura]|uniref:Uncharacterized protein n=1 Tax=Drosophila pseudoobscura pseudoobscura TaxID=46245 RepID=A0A6I8UYX6_DROPS|nr:uncharacterized protein LOC6902139 [Drosophila pseudoobscura]